MNVLKQTTEHTNGKQKVKLTVNFMNETIELKPWEQNSFNFTGKFTKEKIEEWENILKLMSDTLKEAKKILGE